MQLGTHRFWLRTAWCAALLFGVGLTRAVSRLPALSAPPALQPASPARSWPEPVFGDAAPWAVFQRSGSVQSARLGPLAQRFRLAGTFFSYTGAPESEEGPSARMAVLDDLQKHRQHLVEEGAQIDTVDVLRIYSDRILLAADGQREELPLAFLEQEASAADDPLVEAEPPTDPDGFENMPALETSRFGKRIGEARWVLYRDSLLSYYQEMLDQPERIASLYMALQPVTDADQEIAGYVYQPGQAPDELFAAAGVRAGDVIRHVNSMRMVSQPRGEYLMREFLKDNLNTFVFDIERDGEAQKLIYLIR